MIIAPTLAIRTSPSSSSPRLRAVVFLTDDIEARTTLGLSSRVQGTPPKTDRPKGRVSSTHDDAFAVDERTKDARTNARDRSAPTHEYASVSRVERCTIEPSTRTATRQLSRQKEQILFCGYRARDSLASRACDGD